jgi:hypothetical protein
MPKVDVDDGEALGEAPDYRAMWQQAIANYQAELSENTAIRAALGKVEGERDAAVNDLFTLRNRTGCGPEQSGPDVWAERDAARAAVARIASRLEQGIVTYTLNKLGEPSFVLNVEGHTRFANETDVNSLLNDLAAALGAAGGEKAS